MNDIRLKYSRKWKTDGQNVALRHRLIRSGDSGAESRLQGQIASAQALQHRFCHHPQCAVELNVGIDAVNGPGMDTFSFCTATGNPAFQHILWMV